MEPHISFKRLPVAYRALVSGLAVGVVFSTMFLLGWLEPLEMKALDFRFRHYAKRLAPSKDIVIITIDQNSIDYLKNRMDIVWKWPRDVYGYTIKYLTSSGAKAVLMDFDFSDPDIERADYEPGQTDAILGSAIKENGNVINSMVFYREKRTGKYIVDSSEDPNLRKFTLKISGMENLLLDDNGSVVPPINQILVNSRGVGATNVYTDQDGIVRKAQLLQKLGPDAYPNTPLSLAMAVTGQEAITIDNNRSFSIGPHKIRLNNKGEAHINWYGPGGPESGTYKYYPMADVLLSYMRVKEGMKPVIDPAEFKGKIVLLGSNAPSLFDLKPTPLSGDAVYPGVEIVATVINNLLDGNTLRRINPYITVILIMAGALITAFMVAFVKSVTKNVALTVLLMIAAYIYAVAAFYNNVFGDLVAIEASVLSSFMVLTVINYLTEGREKRFIKKAFSQYISGSVMDEITRHPEKLKLGGERREVTILFSDIRGFTSISEKLDPEQLTNILNEYLTPMTDIVFKYEGTLDKYIGDAVMAFFGAPLVLKSHPESACNSALEMLSGLEKLKAHWKERGLPEYIHQMNIGVGLNSGIVSVGNMGSASRFDYTVMGDNVNLSSRLESSTKFYGVKIIASEATYEAVKENFIFRELDRITVIGKKIPIKIYELIKKIETPEADAPVLAEIDKFNSALALYRNRKWQEAAAAFDALHGGTLSEKILKLYNERCENFINNPPPDDWNGVYERSSK